MKRKPTAMAKKREPPPSRTPRTRCSCPTSPQTRSGAFKKVTEPGTAAAQPKLWVFTQVQGQDEGEGAGSRSRLQEGNSACSAAASWPPQPAKKLLRSRAPNPTSAQSATGSGRTDEEEAAARGRRLQIWRGEQ